MGKQAKVRAFKRGSTYSFAFEAGKKPDGKRNTIQRAGFSSEAEAYEAGIKAYYNWKNGNIGITTEKVMLCQYLDSWLEQLKGTVSDSTITTYGFHIRKAKEFFGNVELSAVRPRNVDAFIKQLFKDGKSYNTIKLVRATLYNAMQAAVYPGELIESNPVARIKIPKDAPTDLVKRTIISSEQFSQMMAKLPFGHTMHMPLFIAYHTGMRISEVCGILWRDIDFEKHTLTVQQQVKHKARVGNFLGPLKNKYSYRTIFMGEILEKELLKWRDQQNANKEKFHGGYFNCFLNKDCLIIPSTMNDYEGLPKLDFVCTTNRGRHLYVHLIDKVLARFELNSHSFRHTHATILSQNGASPKEVAVRLGHKKADISIDLYTHSTEKMMQNATDIFEKFAQENADKDVNADKSQT